jgi:FIMAH domain-containing protein
MASWLRVLGWVAAGTVLAAVPDPVGAQDTIPWPAANRLSAFVTGEVTARNGALVTLVYALSSAPTSEQAAQSFVIRTYVSPYAIAAPDAWFGLQGLVQDSAAAHWFALDNESMVQAGETQDGFTFTAAGVLEVVPFRVQGAYDPPAGAEQSGDPVQRPPSFWANSAAGWTIGVVPPSANPAGAVADLRRQRDQACDLGWITKAGVCHSLEVKLDDAAAAIAVNDRERARTRLQAFLSELDAQRGPEPSKSVTENAYWLLKVNAEALIARL